MTYVLSCPLVDCTERAADKRYEIGAVLADFHQHRIGSIAIRCTSRVHASDKASECDSIQKLVVGKPNGNSEARFGGAGPAVAAGFVTRFCADRGWNLVKVDAR